MTTTPQRTHLVEDLAVSLYLVQFYGRTRDDWDRTRPSVRSQHRREAEQLLDDGHLDAVIAQHAERLRERIAVAIERTVPADPGYPRPGRIHREHDKAARGALQSAATIARSTR